MDSEASLSASVVRPKDQVWVQQASGVSFTALNFRKPGGLTTLPRFTAGATGAWHDHPGGEEVYVLQGELTIGGQRLNAGDYLYSPPGARHRVEAHSDVLLFVQLPELPNYDIKTGEEP